MGTQAQKAAAARARAARRPINNPEPAEIPEPYSKNESLMAAQHSPICIDSDSDDDCGYTGGVNVQCLDSEQEEDTDSDSDGIDDSEWSDTESLAELEGEELEENLQALTQRSNLKSPVMSEEVTTLYEEIRLGKSAKAFANAEKNRGLGYNGLSKRTKQLHDKKARDGAATRERARNSNDPQVLLMHTMLHSYNPKMGAPNVSMD